MPTSLEPSPFHQREHATQIIGIVYEKTVYTFIVLSGARDISASIEERTALVELAFISYENNTARNALAAHEQPIDITSERETFYSALTDFLTAATGMPLIAVRERELTSTSSDRTLRCTALVGWELPRSQFDLEDWNRFTPFRRQSRGRTTFAPQRHVPELEEFWREYPQLSIVESFAVFPIIDGERVSAVLSLATACRLDFTPTLKSVIAGIARSIGFTLKNRQLLLERNDLQMTAIETAAALNAVEVFSDVTHQLRNELTAIPEHLELLERRLATKQIAVNRVERSDDYQAILGAVDKVSDYLTTSSRHYRTENSGPREVCGSRHLARRC